MILPSLSTKVHFRHEDRIFFFQGMLNWLIAIGLQLGVLRNMNGPDLPRSSKLLNSSLGFTCLGASILLIGFYNGTHNRTRAAMSQNLRLFSGHTRINVYYSALPLL